MRVETGNWKLKTGWGIVLILAVLAVPKARADWDPNAWPAWQHPRELRTQVSQCYSAMAERCSTVTTESWEGPPSAPTWYRTFRGDVQSLKTYVWENFLFSVGSGRPPYPNGPGKWLNTNAATAGSYDAWFETHRQDGRPEFPPTLTWTGICSVLCIPTNFLDYTPSRGELAGLGGFTNDAPTIGHAHGYTNATTAAGGPYLPAGRSTWYTTDYGVDNLRAVVGQFCWTAYNPIWVYYNPTNEWYGWGQGYASTGATWASTCDMAELGYGDVGGPPVYPYGRMQVGTCGYQQYGEWVAQAASTRWGYRMSILAGCTNAVTVDIYTIAWSGWSTYGATNDTTWSPTWDDQGSGLRSGLATRHYVTNIPAGTRSASVTTELVFASSAIPSPWCVEPSAGKTSLGFYVPYLTQWLDWEAAAPFWGLSFGPLAVGKWDFAYK
jgi:hypothetical protein